MKIPEKSLLSRYERRILDAFAETILPPTPVLMERPGDLGLTERVEHHLASLSRNLRFLFRTALFLIETGAIFTHVRPFTLLTTEQQEKYLRLWADSFLYVMRLFYKLIESICLLNYYSHPRMNEKLGFRPPPTRHRREPPFHVNRSDKDLFLPTDVCVIGSGAGGAVVAKELAEKGRSVVILEEGAFFNINDFGKEPLEVVQRIYRNAGLQVTIGLPPILVPTGRAVGGTTIINSGTCFRLPDKVFERWQREFGLDDLKPEAFWPYFERVERQLNVQPVTEEVIGNCARIFRRGLEKMGLHGTPLLRDVKNCKGSGMCCFGCPTEAKQSVHLSCIPQALEKGAQLFTRCRVESVIPRQEHGAEVIGRFLDSPHTIRVDARVVVLAAGTLNTPYLLKRNQIDLSNSHIGHHLTIHPAAKVIAAFDEEVRGWEGVPQGFQYDGMEAEGIRYEGIFTPPSFGAINLNLPPRRHKEVMERYSHLAAFGFMVTDEGRGSIRWLPNGDPLIFYSIRRSEVGKFVKGTRFMTEVFLNAGAKEVYSGLTSLPVITPETGLRPFEEATVLRKDLNLAAFHPLGTCRMGVDPDRSVVNSVGEMHRVKNLFIADGSIFPSPLGVNPQVTIMAFANRTTDFIDRERL